MMPTGARYLWMSRSGYLVSILVLLDDAYRLDYATGEAYLQSSFNPCSSG